MTQDRSAQAAAALRLLSRAFQDAYVTVGPDGGAFRTAVLAAWQTAVVLRAIPWVALLRRRDGDEADITWDTSHLEPAIAVRARELTDACRRPSGGPDVVFPNATSGIVGPLGLADAQALARRLVALAVPQRQASSLLSHQRALRDAARRGYLVSPGTDAELRRAWMLLVQTTGMPYVEIVARRAVRRAGGTVRLVCESSHLGPEVPVQASQLLLEEQRTIPGARTFFSTPTAGAIDGLTLAQAEALARKLLALVLPESGAASCR